MNIAKQKEILTLRKKAEELEKKYKEGNAALKDRVTQQYLNAAEMELVEYLSAEGFKVDENQTDKSQLVARLDSIWVSMNRHPHALSVYMSNGENYSITVLSTTVPLDDYYKKNASSQDIEIDRLKKYILEVEDRLDNLDKQEFRYCVNTETNGVNGIGYNKKTVLNFKEAMKLLFS